jgi:glycosyltransferase involved in cell wall biosynthesis
MKVLILTRYGRLGASSRLRAYQYLPFLQQAGVEVELMPLLSDEYLLRLYAKKSTRWSAVMGDYFTRALALRHARRFDLLLIEKEIFPYLPAWAEQALSLLHMPWVVDYDDAIFHFYDHSANPFKRLLKRKIDTVMGHASVVICGNEYLAARARAAGAKDIRLIPTVVDLDRYPVRSNRESTGCVVGWVGTPQTLHYLDGIVPALREAACRYPLRLRVVGANYHVEGLAVECRPWSEQSEAEEIAEFDIGIMPLTDTPFERGKCGYKLIQCMACARPVIGSPVGVNREIIEHGECGLLASNMDEWRDAIVKLLANASLRHKMGSHARKRVEENYSLQQVAPRMLQVFHEAAVAPRQ